METSLRLSINVFTLLVAVIIFFGSRSRSDRSFRDYLYFTLMVVVAIAMTVLGAVCWCVDGRAGDVCRFLNTACNTLYFLGNPAVPLLYVLYVLAQIRGRTRRPHLWSFLLALPAAVIGAASLLSAVTGWFFTVDASNVYRRGPLFPLYIVGMFSYLAFAAAVVVIRRRALDRKSALAFILFPFGPALAGVVQGLVFGLDIVWPAIVVSLLLIYVNVQQRKLSIDYLSGAYNRRRLDEYLEERERDEREKGTGFAAFLADIDDFKRINDELGHRVGDRAIVETVRIMRTGLRARDFLGRFAGDEFVAVLCPCGQKELGVVVERVRSRLARPGAWTGSCPPVEVSIGAATFDRAQDKDEDAFLRRLDKLMYMEKMAKKRAHRIAGHK